MFVLYSSQKKNSAIESETLYKTGVFIVLLASL